MNDESPGRTPPAGEDRGGDGRGDRQTRAVVGLLLAVIVAALAYYMLQPAEEGDRALPIPPQATDGDRPGAPASVPPAVPPASRAEPEPHPPAAQLPPLDDSDAPFAAALTALFDAPELPDLLRMPQLLRKGVIIVDNLADRRLPVKYLPLRPPAAKFRVRRQDEQIFLDPANYARYRPYVSLLERLDPADFRAFFRRYAPLFQAAYEELGYPEARFEDRLVAVIDVLLQTPEVTGPIELVQPAVYYKFADPALEALSSGQKALVRMGPENARIVKAKLRQLRAALQE